MANGYSGEERRAPMPAPEREWHESGIAKIIMAIMLSAAASGGTWLLAAPKDIAVQSEQITTLRRDVDQLKDDFAEFRTRRDNSLKEISDQLSDVRSTLIELKSDFRNSGIGRRSNRSDD